MYLKYGEYTHAHKDVSIIVDAQFVRTPRGDPYAIQYAIDVIGSIFGTEAMSHLNNQQVLSSGIAGLLNAYAKDGGDLSFHFNDGSTTPDLNIKNDDCIGGVRVVKPPSLTPRHPGQYTTFWDYSIRLEALKRIGQKEEEIVWDFEESMEYIGTGGPITYWVDLQFAQAQAQRPSPFSKCHAVQEGRITGLNGYLFHRVPQPRFPDLLDAMNHRVRMLPPKKVGKDYTEYTLQYSYGFTNNGPFPMLQPNRI